MGLLKLAELNNTLDIIGQFSCGKLQNIQWQNAQCYSWEKNMLIYLRIQVWKMFNRKFVCGHTRNLSCSILIIIFIWQEVKFLVKICVSLWNYKGIWQI